MINIILASASPRRRELLDRLHLPYTLMPTDADESVPCNTPPDKAAALVSERKAEAALAAGAKGLILAADTIVYINKRILGKPQCEAQAREFLGLLSGNWHEVYTGLTLRFAEKELTYTECTRVHMRELCDSEITSYIATGEPMDKAGAYGIQELGAAFVDRIEGDFYNIMGLPLCRLSLMLREFL